MGAALVSLIPVVTAALYVGLTGRIGAKITRRRFIHVYQNWAKLSTRGGSRFSEINDREGLIIL